jgi:hypothetical protein
MSPLSRRLLLLVFGILPLAALPAGGDPAPPAAEAKAPRRGGAHLVGWWQREEFCAELGIDPALRKQLAAELDNMQVTYQVIQTRLTEARQRQSALLLDPAAGKDKLYMSHGAVAAASDSLRELNFEARLLVRDKLKPGQLARIAGMKPQFFASRWFKASAVPVLEGKVAADEE